MLDKAGVTSNLTEDWGNGGMMGFISKYWKSLDYPIIGDESMMNRKANGSTDQPPQKNLKFGCDFKTA